MSRRTHRALGEFRVGEVCWPRRGPGPACEAPCRVPGTLSLVGGSRLYQDGPSTWRQGPPNPCYSERGVVQRESVPSPRAGSA